MPPKRKQVKPKKPKSIEKKTTGKRRRPRTTRNSNATATGNTSRINITLGGKLGASGMPYGGSTVVVSQPQPIYQTPQGPSYRDHPSFIDPVFTERLDAFAGELRATRGELDRIGAMRQIPGPRGPIGPRGADGRDGVNGLDGIGFEGPMGPRGPAGDTIFMGYPSEDPFGPTDTFDPTTGFESFDDSSFRPPSDYGDAWDTMSPASEATYSDMPDLESIFQTASEPAVRPNYLRIQDGSVVLPEPDPIVKPITEESVIAKEDETPSSMREEIKPELPGDILPEPKKNNRGGKTKPFSYYQDKYDAALVEEKNAEEENRKNPNPSNEAYLKTARRATTKAKNALKSRQDKPPDVVLARKPRSKKTKPDVMETVEEGDEETEYAITLPTPRREAIQRRNDEFSRGISNPFLPNDRGMYPARDRGVNGGLSIRLPDSIPKANSYKDVITDSVMKPRLRIGAPSGSSTMLGFGDDMDEDDGDDSLYTKPAIAKPTFKKVGTKRK
jgi:hypothetical protein